MSALYRIYLLTVLVFGFFIVSYADVLKSSQLFIEDHGENVSAAGRFSIASSPTGSQTTTDTFIDAYTSNDCGGIVDPPPPDRTSSPAGVVTFDAGTNVYASAPAMWTLLKADGGTDPTEINSVSIKPNDGANDIFVGDGAVDCFVVICENNECTYSGVSHDVALSNPS